MNCIEEYVSKHPVPRRTGLPRFTCNEALQLEHHLYRRYIQVADSIGINLRDVTELYKKLLQYYSSHNVPADHNHSHKIEWIDLIMQEWLDSRRVKLQVSIQE